MSMIKNKFVFMIIYNYLCPMKNSISAILVLEYLYNTERIKQLNSNLINNKVIIEYIYNIL